MPPWLLLHSTFQVTGGNLADINNVMGHVCQDHLQLSAADHKPVVSVFQVGAASAEFSYSHLPSAKSP